MAESEDNFLRTESVETWPLEGRAAYEAEREALLYYTFFFFFFTGARYYSNQTLYYFMRGAGFVFLDIFFLV